ncbi:histidine phosphatase family protein [Tepidicella baoligensis]|uniref:histidine phosphatase family protein n=1 Tax=Tepidicella baoligensis TaxID=2707016 RepID=UPI001FEAD44E|nr:histidine phosphatase family protein [Tepidicella baoligensis]
MATNPRHRRRHLCCLAGAAALASFPTLWVHAATTHSTGQAREDERFWTLTREGGYVLLMRHAATVAGVGDPPGFRLDDCHTQRNLSESGREAAQRLGERFRERGVRLSAVYSSAWCRCIDTARLAFDPHYPPHRVWPALNSFFQGHGSAAAQTQELLQRAALWCAPGHLMLVTHQVNITAVTSLSPGMGEVFLTRFEASRPDRLTVLARLTG